jgi:PAS domain S-box-containing protein
MDIELLKQELQREIKARNKAERLLKNKKLELYHTSNELALAHKKLYLQKKRKEKSSEELIMINREQDRVAKQLIIPNKILSVQDKRKDGRTNELASIKVELEQQIICLNKAAIVSETDANFKITVVNDNFCERYGYHREELMGQNHRILKSGKQPDVFFTDMISTISSGKVFKGKVLNKHKGGQLYWMDITIMPFKDLNGKIIKYVAIMFDINSQTVQKDILLKQTEQLAIANTELAFQNKEKEKRADELALANRELEFQNKEKQKRAEELVLANKEKEKRANELILANKELAFQTELDVYRSEMERVAHDLTLLIDTANAPIFGIDNKGLVNEWNQTSEKITGFKKEEVLGKDLVQTYITEDYRKSVNKVLDDALLGIETANFEFPLFSKDNQRVMVLLNSSTRRNADGKIVGVLGVGQDITEIKKTEQKEAERQKISNQFSSSLVTMSNVSIKSHDNWESIITQELTSLYEFYKLDRMSIWLPDLKGFRMLAYEGDKPNPEGLDFISFTDHPIYFENSKKSHLIISNEVENDARLIELNEYFNITKTRSLLDASAMIDNKLIAIICFENCTPHNWTLEETYFIRSFSENITTLFLRFEDRNSTQKNELIATELRQFIETANAPIFGIDAKGKVNEWNQTSEKITGFKKEEVLGKDLVETYITEDYREAVKRVLDNALKGKETANFEFPLFSKDNQRVMVLLNSSTRRNADGKIVGVLGVGQDISEIDTLRTASESIATELRQFIETANAPIFGIDSKGLVNEWNQTSESITGFTKAEVLGKDLVRTYITEDYRKSVNKVLDDALLGIETANYEFPLFTKDGRRVMVLLNSSTRRDINGGIIGVLGVGQDITELAGYRNELELKVNERTLKLNEALEKQKGLNILKSRFVSTASHEFRTPLSSINFAAGSIKKYWSKMGPEMIKKKLNKIEDQVLHMTKLLDDILIIGQGEAGKIKQTPAPVNLGEFISEIIEEVYSSINKSHEIILIDREDLKKTDVFIDEKLGRNVFINLLSNAVKYSPNAQKVTVELSSEKDYTIISVTDFGIGISALELKTIFEPFSRGENVDLIQGTGLGLAIVKEAIDVIGGKIIVNSTVGNGSSFIIKILNTSKTCT